MSEASKQVLFEEKQQFRQPSLWVVLLGLSLLITYGLIRQIFLGSDFGSRPATNDLLILIWLIFGVGFPWAFWKAALTTRVYPDGIGITFFPLKRGEEIFRYDQIFKVETIIYRPILDYSSYGVNNSAKGRAYNVHGKKGVKLWFKADSPLLIGSQRSDELCAICKGNKIINCMPDELFPAPQELHS